MELKAYDARFFGFRDGRNFYITGGAMKAKSRVQERDYNRAVEARTRFMAINPPFRPS
jgi:hypothetical protein